VFLLLQYIAYVHAHRQLQREAIDDLVEKTKSMLQGAINLNNKEQTKQKIKSFPYFHIFNKYFIA